MCSEISLKFLAREELKGSVGDSSCSRLASDAHAEWHLHSDWLSVSVFALLR